MAEKKPKIEIKAIVRVAGTNLNGEQPLLQALRGIKGINYTMAKALCSVSGIAPDTKLGTLSEKDIERLEEIIKKPTKFGIPGWVLNRRKDIKSGEDLHITGPELKVAQRFDIKRLIDLKSYRGIRHMFGLPVRGQRTRSSFRKGKTVGVMRKAARIRMAKEGKKK
jgi:small subunit ribosomal protein S13